MTTIKPVGEIETVEELVKLLIEMNAAYRSGKPLVDDDTFDHVYLAELRKRDPDNEYFDIVEDEGDFFGENKYHHETPMLSTDKAYDQEDVKRFVKRVSTAAQELGIDPTTVEYRITAKLDGMAGKYLDSTFATRGNGLQGSDITYTIDSGVSLKGTGGVEIFLSNPYFEENLKDEISHPRNFFPGAIGADTLHDLAAKAFSDGAIEFVTYDTLPSTTVDGESLISDIESLCKAIEDDCPYPVDGSVIDVMNDAIREYMGATSHHNKWQLAKKTQGETATAVVISITWQTGRTGRITPVINIQTTNLSGANISNITGHHAGNIRNLNVGVGSIVKFVRSGEVIPKLLGVVESGEKYDIPTECPSCSSPTKWENDFLVCTGHECPAQIESQLIHFFSTIGNIDLFGPKTIETLVNNGFNSLQKIYSCDAAAFRSMGFGEKQSDNLVKQLERSRKEKVEDWRFLAAFGIHHLGKGDSRKILEIHPLPTLNSLTEANLKKIRGFGAITSKEIPEGIQRRWPTIEQMLALEFNLTNTVDELAAVVESPITGKNIVFTGSMNSNRDEMKKNAKANGANVQSSVNGKTDYLVTGAKVGQSKIDKAKKHGTKVLTEEQYYEMLNQ